MNYDDPAAEERWCAETRARVVDYLAHEGVDHGAVGEWPARHVSGVVSIWAIDEWHQPMYLFPRDCPRILMWRIEGSTARDIERTFGTSAARMVAYIEHDWMVALRTQTVFRYELPSHGFVALNDAGMWVARSEVQPMDKVAFSDLPNELARSGVEIRPVDALAEFRDAWDGTLHVSGIRLRNAVGWDTSE